MARQKMSGEEEVPQEENLEETDLSSGDGSEETEDLMSMLAGSSDANLGDIGALLDADSSGNELDESREEFESLSDAADDYGEETEISLDGEEEKKPGFFDKLKNIFKGKPKAVNKMDAISDENEAIATAQALDEENQQILSEMGELPGEDEISPDDDGTGLLANFFKKKKAARAAKKEEKANAPKPEKHKKEKKPKKENKPKEKKEKTPKPVDNSPVIPLKAIIVQLVFAVSVIALVFIGSKLISQHMAVSDAQNKFNKGLYMDSYEELQGRSFKKGSDEEKILNQSRLLSDLQSRLIAYQALSSKGKYEMALNQLLVGYDHYQKNLPEAQEYGVEMQYTELHDHIIEALSSQFNVSQDRADEILKAQSRKDYTRKVKEVLAELNLTED